MSVQAHLTLPPGVASHDLGTFLNGLVSSPGYKLEDATPGCTRIVLGQSPPLLGGFGFSFLHHLEWWAEGRSRGNGFRYWYGSEPGSTGIITDSSPIMVAILLRVAEFFGGIIDCRDDDERAIDFVFESHVPPLMSERSERMKWNKKINDLRPLNALDVEWSQQWSRYEINADHYHELVGELKRMRVERARLTGRPIGPLVEVTRVGDPESMWLDMDTGLKFPASEVTVDDGGRVWPAARPLPTDPWSTRIERKAREFRDSETMTDDFPF